ncbi:MAG: LamG-like jellyroll fold domain-containing protein, partial [Planctomycetota bacterium]
AARAGNAPEPEEMAARNRWLAERVLRPVAEPGAPGAVPAFSFRFGGEPSEKLLAAWPRAREETELPRGRNRHTIAWRDPASNLEVRQVAVAYEDFPALEWTVYVRNAGERDSAPLEDVQGLDVRIERSAAGEFRLVFQKGDTCAPDLYQPLEEALGPGRKLRFAPAGGRGTNGAFPYYDLVFPGGGVFIAIGWPGQWCARFERDAERGLRIVAGQELTHLVLRPGEEIRTPLVALLFWSGSDLERAQNLWRRWMIAHNLPRTADGALPPPILPGNSSLEFNEMTEADEECQKYFIDRYIAERIPIDFWWMDAGWYPSSGWPQTGTWEPDLRRFPRGLRAISDHARTKGVRTLVWFEPERVAPGTYLREKHPEWLLGGTLLDLGKAEARAWLTDHVDRLLREQGIDLYRQDFNMDPLAYWRGNDAPDRQGITENFHIQGYLAYWDALRERHPQLVIDSCASGGRRNDLETLRRAVPLHPTDYNYAHLAAKQAFHQSLFRWVPYFGSNTVPVDTVDAYAFRSGHALSTVLGYDVRRKDLDYDLLRKLATTLRKIQNYYYADYYPLAPYTLAETDWIAWQFHDPETGSGLVEAFRRPRSPLASSRFRLRGLDAEAIYEFEDADAEGLRRFSGSELLELGLPVALPRRPQAATIVYRRLRGLAAAASPSAVSPEVGEPVTFTAVVSGAGPGEVASFRWDFGDGSAAEGPRVEHAYAAPGAYSVELVATGPGGAKDATRTSLTVRPEDRTPPAILFAAASKPDEVAVVFSEPVERSSAERASNYAIDRGVEVRSASLGADLVTVTLRTSPLAKGTRYELEASGVRDRASRPRSLPPGTRVSFEHTALYGWWKLDDGQGEIARDSSGNGHGGALAGPHGGPSWTQSERGTALRFDGRGAFVETDTYLADLEIPFTISVWVNPAERQVQHADILGNHGEPYVGINIQQDGDRTNRFGFGFGDGRRWQGAGPVRLEAGRWQHLAAVADGEAAVLYVDGFEKSRNPAKGPFAPNPAQNFKIGQGYHTGRFFQGLLKDVRIYREALSADEVRKLSEAAP